MAQRPADNTKPSGETLAALTQTEKTSIMLVLTRKETQTILIGDNIVIRIVQAGASSVKIGIEAPRDIRIVRGELEALDIPVPVSGEFTVTVTRDQLAALVGAA